MKVVIIGTGNVAWLFGKKILEAGHDILQVVGRNFEKVNELASHLRCASAYNARYINVGADIYIIAVSDSAIPIIASQLNLPGKVVVHTAAAVAKDVLAVSSENFGVIYPLQTLVKEIVEVPSIPLLVDGVNETTIKTLTDFAKDWGENVKVANDEERLKLHVAATIVSNFTNHLYTITEEYCKKEQLKFNMLLPLIEETIKRLKTHSPNAVQTGPAAREDHETIEKHTKLLESYPDLLKTYNSLSNSIITFYDKNKI